MGCKSKHVFGELQARRSKLKDALMFKNALIVALAALMVPPLQSGQQTSATVQDEVAKLTKGSMIEVKLKSRKKVNGRLGEVSADGFELQVSQGQKADNLNLLSQMSIGSPRRRRPREVVRRFGSWLGWE
jgi:hypothetical protein